LKEEGGQSKRGWADQKEDGAAASNESVNDKSGGKRSGQWIIDQGMSVSQESSSLHHWRAACAEKAANAIAMKLKSTEKDLINISYLNWKYFSPGCWKTVCRALDEFEKLTSKKDKIKCVKEQILIRYLGLGWEEAHHPW
jgi:hypothetical protein